MAVLSVLMTGIPLRVAMFMGGVLGFIGGVVICGIVIGRLRFLNAIERRR
jgi:hypothetical protein